MHFEFKVSSFGGRVHFGVYSLKLWALGSRVVVLSLELTLGYSDYPKGSM